VSGDLLLFVSPDEPGLSWARVGAHGGKVTTGRTGADAKPLRLRDGERVTLLVPGDDVALHRVELPARTQAQARAAAPYAVEDLVAQPLDDVYVIPGPRRADDSRRAVAVADRAVFGAWRDAFAAAGAAADRIVADFMALPAAPDEVCVVDLGARVLAHGAGVGFAIEAELAREVLAAALARSEARAVRLWSDRPDEILPKTARDGREISLERALDDEALAQLFQRGLEADAVLDLSHADAPPRDDFTIEWKRWRMAAALALAAGLGYAALLVVQTASLDRETDAAYAEAEALLREAFPDIGRVVNPRAQLRARLGEQDHNAAAFLALSGLVADSVREIDSLEISSIRFDAARAELDIVIRYARYDDVDRLSSAILARGGELEEGGSRASGDLMMSDIVVRGRP
jgi:general secretion pathway protein L